MTHDISLLIDAFENRVVAYCENSTPHSYDRVRAARAALVKAIGEMEAKAKAKP